MKARQFIYDLFEKERGYQMSLWSDEFDDKNTLHDWVAYITRYLGRLTDNTATKKAQKYDLIKIGALVVAALETFERNSGFPPRHYDQVFKP